MIYVGIAGLFVAGLCAVYLIRSGYEGAYDDPLVDIMIQALFVLSFCGIIVGFASFSMTWLYVGAGLSFALIGAGALACRWPLRSRAKRKGRGIGKAWQRKK